MKYSRKIALAMAMAVVAAPAFADPAPRAAADAETPSERSLIQVIIDALRSPGAIKN